MRRRIARTLLALIVFGSIAPLAVAAETRHAGPDTNPLTLTAVAEYVEAGRESLGIPGVAYAIVSHGEIVASGGAGRADGDRPMTADTPVMVASLSKSITAMAVMQQVEAGTIDLDAPITDYLPELNPKAADVTVRDLLHHRSGASTYDGTKGIADDAGKNLTTNVGRFRFQGGSGFAYSNANYDALALIVERASGKPFGEYVRVNLFEAIGMTRSTTDPATAAADGLAQGHYHWLVLGYRPYDAPMPDGLIGSARMFSTAEDLARLLLTHLGEGSIDGAQVLSPASVAALHTPVLYDDSGDTGYAMGLESRPAFDPLYADDATLLPLTMLIHDGSWPTYRSFMWFVPEADLGFVLVANGNDLADETQLGQVSRGVRYLLFHEEPPPVRSDAPPLLRWGKHLLATLALIQLGLALMTVGVLWRRRAPDPMTPADRRLLIASSVVDLVAFGVVVWVIPLVGDAPLSVALTSPDYRILILFMLGGFAWGLVRATLLGTVLAIRHRRGPVTP